MNTPLASTMADLAAVYLNNRETLLSVMRDVDAEVSGIAPNGTGGDTAGATVTSGSAVGSPGGSSAVSAGNPAGPGMPAVSSHGGLFGSALTSGAASLGDPARAAALVPASLALGPGGLGVPAVAAAAGLGHVVSPALAGGAPRSGGGLGGGGLGGGGLGGGLSGGAVVTAAAAAVPTVGCVKDLGQVVGVGQAARGFAV